MGNWKVTPDHGSEERRQMLREAYYRNRAGYMKAKEAGDISECCRLRGGRRRRMTIEFLQSASKICFGIAIASAILAAALFFLLDIWENFLIETDRESLFSFPTPHEFMRIEMGMLKAAGVGYRLPYICDARDKVTSGEIDLIALEELSDEGLFDTLKTIYGVGNKIANCVCLYAYGRISRVPIDTWIRKVIDNTCEGRNPFPGFGDVAGVIQQYVFYTEQMRSRGLWVTEIEEPARSRRPAEADAGDTEDTAG